MPKKPQRKSIETAFEAHRFQLTQLGGNVHQYVLAGDGIDIIVSGVNGEPPKLLTDPVVMAISPTDSDVTVCTLAFKSLSAFFDAMDEGEQIFPGR